MTKAEKIIKAINDSDIQKIYEYPSVISVTTYGLLITFQTDSPFPTVIQITNDMLEVSDVYDNEIIVEDIIGDSWSIFLFKETPLNI